MEELSLKWDEHHPAVISVFEELLEKGTLVDCTIAADGQYVKAHKVVLAACSPYFELLFSQEHEKNPIVVLKDIKFQELKYLIDFVYRGQVKLQQDQLDAFVAAAESLQIKGLSDQQRKKIPEKSTSKAVVSKEGHASPVPCKRRRSSSGQTEDSQSVPSPGNDTSSDGNVREGLLSTTATSVPSTSAASTIGNVPHILSARQDRCDPKASFSSRDQPSSSPEEVLPDVAAVIKTEPEDTEPLAEVFFPEPKSEEYVDEMALLESGDGPAETHGDTSQQGASDYPGFPSYNSSGSTFLMNQIADPSATPVAGLSRTYGGLSRGGTGPEERDAAVGARPSLLSRTDGAVLENAAPRRGGATPAESTLSHSASTRSSRASRSSCASDSMSRRGTRDGTVPGSRRVNTPRERPAMGTKRRLPDSAARPIHMAPASQTSKKNSSASRISSCDRGGFRSNVNLTSSRLSSSDFPDVKPDPFFKPPRVNPPSSMPSTSSSPPERKLSTPCNPPLATLSDTKSHVFRDFPADAGVSSGRPAAKQLKKEPRDRGLRFLCPICMVVYRKCIRTRKPPQAVLFNCAECGYAIRSRDRL